MLSNGFQGERRGDQPSPTEYKEYKGETIET